ncbi:hypothetical protein Oweho_3206 [Owenweeksia hongkongensis DSM 17368]|uniref:Uncharacterized protein n=1 Tax=Owenweeksia hongkongensis (strain DSM 17368 / CIP 108786 / JCM 12287 / NRRL B-23963 / UST20020801) TaxID=926562 RepID=G8R3S0_OWEHD|nr:hypothetical protein [Owenweeksia hongkongensis]AEV34157.1 hypothetical protein Oweho_3206 [Owenweeksia hongkongensis DSM 17368]
MTTEKSDSPKTKQLSPVDQALLTELKELTISSETIRLLGFMQELEPGKVARNITHNICELAMLTENQTGSGFTNMEVVTYLRLQLFLMSWQEDIDQE